MTIQSCAKVRAACNLAAIVSYGRVDQGAPLLIRTTTPFQN